MPHLDDGILHAWLDGALEALAAADALPDGMQAADVAGHLEFCADCRGRLELERQTRERAGLVLRDAAPSPLETPSFPALGGAAPTPRRRTMLPYAWAASVLLAAGAGWWGSQISRDPRAAAPTVRTMESEAAPDATELPSPAGTGTDRPSELSGPASDEGAGRAVAAPAARPSAAVERGRDDVSELPPPPPPVERAADAAGAVRGDAPPAPAPSVAPLAESTLPPPQPETPSPAALAAALQFLARDSAGLVQWRPIAGDEVQQIDSLAFTLARADVVARAVSRDLGVRAVRVSQRLPDGEEVEVVTWRLEQVTPAASIMEAASLDSPASRRGVARTEAQRQLRAPTGGDSTRLESRSAAAEKASHGALTLLRTPSALPGARQETVFTVGGEDVVVTVRAPLRIGARELAERLGIRP